MDVTRALYARLPAPVAVLLALDADPTLHELRRRLLEQVVAFPGLHMSELARVVGVAPQHAQYHLRVLERVGLVAALRQDANVRFYPTKSTPLGPLPALVPSERASLRLLRRPGVLRILVVLLLDGPMGLAALARGCQAPPATVHHHLRRLVREGWVHAAATAPPRWEIQEPDHIRRLLLAHDPPSRAIDGFLETWRRLGP